VCSSDLMARKDDQPSKKPTAGSTADSSTREEAQHLAEEAVQEMKQGNTEEADFVLNEARSLDKDAVEQVLKREHKGKP